MALVAVVAHREALEPLVDVALARHVVVRPDDVGRARVGRERLELRRGGAAGAGEPAPERVLARDYAKNQAPRDAAQIVGEFGVVSELRGAVILSEVVGLHKLGGRIHLADLAHRQGDGAALLKDPRPEYRGFGAGRYHRP